MFVVAYWLTNQQEAAFQSTNWLYVNEFISLSLYLTIDPSIHLSDYLPVHLSHEPIFATFRLTIVSQWDVFRARVQVSKYATCSRLQPAERLFELKAQARGATPQTYSWSVYLMHYLPITYCPAMKRTIRQQFQREAHKSIWHWELGLIVCAASGSQDEYTLLSTWE